MFESLSKMTGIEVSEEDFYQFSFAFIVIHCLFRGIIGWNTFSGGLGWLRLGWLRLGWLGIGLAGTVYYRVKIHLSEDDSGVGLNDCFIYCLIVFIIRFIV